MTKLSILMDFLGSMEPGTWFSSRGIKAGPYAAMLFCCYVFFRDGIRRGAWAIAGYIAKVAVLITVISTVV